MICRIPGRKSDATPAFTMVGFFWKCLGVAKRHHLPFFCQAFRPL